MIVVREPWRFHPLAWIHRTEAAKIARELGASMVDYPATTGERALLRLSDPVMRQVLGEIRSPYFGPGREALERCYDKHEATRIVRAAGFDAPDTFLGDSPSLPRAPFIVKPRRGSDSLGVHIASEVAPSKRNAEHLLQSRIIGQEVTVALFRGEVGLPFHILVPPGEIHSFSSKYLFRPGKRPMEGEEALRDRAGAIGKALGVDWAARVDFIIEEKTKRVMFLECDAAPLVGPDSAFAASFTAAGVDRRRQLDWLVS